ncbi:MAG: tRNA (adenosine(37)-N6)-threonylcarbamoyltransferase complex ATPase subunit type 1 TsaE [Pseudomonadota bacterium]
MISLETADRTESLGAAIAKHIEPGDVIALHGDLGAGKTTFSRGLISALFDTPTEVPSPTYNLVQLYETPDFDLWHFDLYRLESPEDLIELGWEETQHGVALIEWPDRAGDQLPQYRLDVRLEIVGETRTAHLEARGEVWQSRLNGFAY